ncbi:hypothetical protein [Methylobacterium sp. W2]|uniref:hypothetical protein n=1 Tax=Methylobacterium sp. W2 TaxID=2598107 RepID=UPI001D0C19A7|nr:hypothetical protein [Methylobacterium sp. W2]
MTFSEDTALQKWRERKDTSTIVAEMRAAGFKVDEAWVYKTIADDQNRRYRARQLARMQA